MKDLIIGSICNYQPKDVACWINSINHSGFIGDVAVLDFGNQPETIEFLQRRGVTIYKADLNGRHIVVERFIAMYSLLQGMETEYDMILATDCKDVIFQDNPSPILGERYHPDRPIIVSSENIRYQDEDWGRNNMQTSYPHMYERMKDKVIYNAGIITGYFPDFRDFCLHIYHLSLIGQDRQPDQAAMNILLQTAPYLYSTMKWVERDEWAINLGTSWADNVKDKYKDKLVNGFTQDISKFCIIHQWDRVSSLIPIIQSKFGSLT